VVLVVVESSKLGEVGAVIVVFIFMRYSAVDLVAVITGVGNMTCDLTEVPLKFSIL